jgi:hypothetical protein
MSLIKLPSHIRDCKCFDCRLLRAQKAKEGRERRKIHGKVQRDYRHGRVQCYWRGCRRKECVAANAKYNREWRGRGLVSPALALPIVSASGSWVLSKRSGISLGAILNIKRRKTKRIRRATERKIIEAGVSTARQVSPDAPRRQGRRWRTKTNIEVNL